MIKMSWIQRDNSCKPDLNRVFIVNSILGSMFFKFRSSSLRGMPKEKNKRRTLQIKGIIKRLLTFLFVSSWRNKTGAGNKVVR